MRIVAFAGNLGCGKDTAADRVVLDHGFVRVSLADPLKRFGASVFGFTEDQLWGPSDSRNALDDRYRYGWSEEWEYAYDRLRVEGPCWLADDVFTSWVGHTKHADAEAALHFWFAELRAAHPKLSPRIMLQSLGTEFGRVALYQDVWLDAALHTAKQLLTARPDSDGLVAKSYTRTLGVLYGNYPGNTVTGVVIPDSRFPNEWAGIKKAGGKVLRIYRPATDSMGSTTGIANHASETSLNGMLDSEFDFILYNEGSLEEFLAAVDVAARVVLTAG